MATEDLRFRFLADARDFLRKSGDVQQSMSRTQRATSAVRSALKSLAIAFGAREVVQWAGDAIQLAAAAEEVDSKFRSVFGAAKDLTQTLEEWGDVAGVTTTDAKDLAATFGNLAMAQGLSRDETEDLTVKVAQLAGDLASFNDVDPSTVFNDLNKALLTTEREGMKKYGIALTETEIKQKALEIATADGRSEVTKADRALASYELAVKQAGKAVGDLERTSDSTANQQRQLKASLKETQEEIGRKLLPVYADLVELTAELVPLIGDAADELRPLIDGFGWLASAASGAADNGVAKVVGKFVDLVGWANPVSGTLKLINRTMGETEEQAEYTRDAFGDLRGSVVGLAGANRDAAGGVATLTEALKDQTDYLARLDSALSGDLFAKYRRFVELQGLAAGGRGNVDWDRGDGYSEATSGSATSDATTYHNKINGAS